MNQALQETQKFAQDHEHKIYVYPQLPSMTNQIDWILNDSGAPWLPLIMDAPFEQMLNEARALRHRFVRHRMYDGEGWHSLCLHGLAADMTDSHSHYGIPEDQAKYDWTEIAELAPVTTYFFKTQFPYKSYQRVRFMMVEPGGYIKPHSDAVKNYLGLAINFSLNNPPGCRLVTELGTVPFSDQGSIMMFNNHYTHCVINDSDQERYHMIVHGLWKPSFFNPLIINSYQAASR